MALVNINIDTIKNTLEVNAGGKKLKNVRSVEARMIDPMGYGEGDDNDGDETVHLHICCVEDSEDFKQVHILTKAADGVNITLDTTETLLFKQIQNWRGK